MIDMLRLTSKKFLRVGIVSGILHPKYGGPISVIKSHVIGFDSSVQTEIFGVIQADENNEVRKLFPEARLFRKSFPSRWFHGRGLESGLEEAAAHLDLFHAHMLWDHPTWATWRVAKRNGKPFVVTPHGSFSETWRINGLHKRVYSWLILNGLLNDVGAVHVLTQAESEACRNWGFKGRVKIIPNALPAREFVRPRDPELAWRRWPFLKNRRIMLYLGRLWWQKGLDILPEAWAAAQRDDEWLLVLAGPDYRGYQKELLAKIHALRFGHSILLVGPVSDEIKSSLFDASECFILPSHSEGFSIALLEAMAASLPCIFTQECHFTELALYGGGWEIPFKKEILIKTILEVCRRTPDENKSMGERARSLGLMKYSTENVAKELISLYRSLL